MEQVMTRGADTAAAMRGTGAAVAACSREAKRLAAILEAVAVPLYVVDDRGHLIFCNELAAEIRDMWPQRVGPGLGGDQGPGWPPEDEADDAWPTPMPVADAVAGSAGPVVLRGPDGSERRVTVHAKRIHDEQGCLLGTLSVVL